MSYIQARETDFDANSLVSPMPQLTTFDYLCPYSLSKMLNNLYKSTTFGKPHVQLHHQQDSDGQDAVRAVLHAERETLCPYKVKLIT